jgi:glutathione-independent formaldehyde dehydrogenase
MTPAQKNACMQMINLDQAPQGYGEFDAGVPKKFVIDPQNVWRGAMP